MKNKKLLTTLTTGILAFTLNSQSVSAAVPLIIEVINKEESETFEEGIALNDFVKIENTEVEEILSTFTVKRSEKNDNEIILSGELDSIHQLEFTTLEEKVEINEPGKFEVSIHTSEKNGEFNLVIFNDESLIEEIVVDIQQLINQLNRDLMVAESESKTLEEASIDEENEQEDVIVTSDELNDESSKTSNTDNSEPKIENTENDSENPQDTKAEIENSEVIEEETVTEEKTVTSFNESDEPIDDEESVSLPRSSEVEELLFGNEEQFESTMERSLVNTSSSRTHVNGVYTVVSGDTFKSIATSFNLSRTQLIYWNTHITNPDQLKVGTKLAVTRAGVESMLSAADKARLTKSGDGAQFDTPQEFIDFIAPLAIEVANQENTEALYPSLMIAQAAHESNYGRSTLGAPPYYNLSGIKGTHNGDSVLMWTWEVYNGVSVNVLAGFRDYPSYTASLQDYANLLRNGLSWSRNYYSGTWRSTASDVWDVLENKGLRGYATDPNYYTAIKNTINNYNLTQYDSGNYYVRTGTFLGQSSVESSVKAMKTVNPNMSYRYEKTTKTPYQNRRVETVKEFVGENAAKRAVEKIKSDKSWYSSYRKTSNSTKHVRIQSGYFNSRSRAEQAVRDFKEASGLYATIEEGQDGKYRLRTGYFVGESNAQESLKYMENLGWFAKTVETGDSTPNYVVYTGVFPNPSAVKDAHTYFASSNWNSKETMVDRQTYYYRVYVEGFPSKTQATSYVNQLQKQYGWYSSAIPVE